MTDLKQYNCLVYDYGSNLSLAMRLSREDGFGKTYYFVPTVHNGYPDHKPIDIGRNVPNVIKVKEWAEVINEVDCVIFPDVYEPALQTYFKSIGKAVFGSKYACELEYDRVRLKELLTEYGLPVNEYEVAKGIDELDSILQERVDVFVKNKLRGDSETWHHTNYNLSKGELQRMRASLGAYQNQETYLVETPIDSIAEVGIDTFCINGLYPSNVLTGIEIKDSMYYGVIVPYMQLPRQLRNVTDKFSNIFRELGYCGAHSNEVMISKDLRGYAIDFTNRCPSPPFELMQEMITNFPEVIWQVANGIVPEIQYQYKHGVQLIIKSDLAKTDASPIIVPYEYEKYVKIKNLTIDDDGTWYYTPLGVEMQEIGSVVFAADTMREAISGAKKIAESIQGFDIKINTDCISKAKEQIERLEKAGISYI